MSAQLPNGLIAFGPNANCTLELCPIQWSVYQYRPSLAANITFLVIFALAMVVHIYLGIRWRSWLFMSFIVIGCIVEIGGYAGRIVLYNNPFSFPGFISQIVLITTAPVFYTASIYVTLSKTINFLAPELARFNPKLLYWIFIPADLVCLILQAAGGAISTVSTGSSQSGVDIALAGLGLQVAVLAIFTALFADYIIRYVRSKSTAPLSSRTRLFLAGLGSAVVLILGRCIYRCYELSKGYTNSDLITDQGLFIGLEGVLIVLAVFALCIGHPGMLFGPKAKGDRPNAMSDVEKF